MARESLFGADRRGTCCRQKAAVSRHTSHTTVAQTVAKSERKSISFARQRHTIARMAVVLLTYIAAATCAQHVPPGVAALSTSRAYCIHPPLFSRQPANFLKSGDIGRLAMGTLGDSATTALSTFGARYGARQTSGTYHAAATSRNALIILLPLAVDF